MTKCPECGAIATESQRFCGECGTRLPQSNDDSSQNDRNAVMHRPGGGRPDPWAVGAAEPSADASEESGEDDFFSQFRPKSAAADGDEVAPPQPATRRSRRRFNPDLNEDASSDSAQQPSAKPASKPAPQPPAQTAPQPAAPEAARPPRSPFAGPAGQGGSAGQGGHAGQAGSTQRAQQPQRQEQRSQRPAPQPESEPSTAAMSLDDIEEALKSDREQQASQSASSAAGAADTSRKRNWAQPQPPIQVQPQAQQPPTPGQATGSEPNKPAQSRSTQAQPTQSRSTQAQPAQSAQPGRQQTPAQQTPAQQPPAQPPRQREENTGPAWWASSKRREPKPADDATFTQLIQGLENDPADDPIVAHQGFDKTGIVPLPAQPRDQRSDGERQAQQRAAEFYGSADNEMPKLPPIDAGDQPATQQLSTQQPAVQPTPTEQAAAEQAATQQPATQRSEPSSDDPIMSPFVMEAGDAPRQARPQPSGQSQGSAGRPQPVASQESADDGFWPFGDELDGDVTAAGSSAVGAGSGGGGRSGGGAAGGSGGGSNEADNKRRGLRTILIAAVAAVVIIVGAFAISGLFGGGDETPVADETQEQEQPAEEPGGQPDQEPNEEPGNEPGAETPDETVADFEPVAFQSNSGNIRCEITSENGALCQLMSTNFAAPAEQCPTSAASGVAVSVTGDGITWPCLTGNLPGGTVVGYDEPVTAGEYTCSINFATGVTCENEEGDSYSLEFNTGVTVDGNSAADTHQEVTPGA